MPIKFCWRILPRKSGVDIGKQVSNIREIYYEAPDTSQECPVDTNIMHDIKKIECRTPNSLRNFLTQVEKFEIDQKAPKTGTGYNL